MGAVHSRTSRAAEFDVRELHGIAFRRALRKQDRRLERDAVALRRRRGGESGPSRRRERDERPRVNDGDDGIPIPIVAHEAARGFRRDTNEREEERWGDDRTETETERRRAAEEMRALRLECARREAKARQRREAEREKRRADRRRRGDDENDGDGDGENGSRFDELLAACAADEARHAARSASKRRRERERRREASERRGRILPARVCACVQEERPKENCSMDPLRQRTPYYSVVSY